MKKTLHSIYRIGFIPILLLLLSAKLALAQSPVPLELKNTSEFRDDEVYVAIIGKDLAVPAKHIWVDVKTGTQYPMSSVYNTVSGPVYGGNKGPGGDGKYANCFTKLSEIPNKTLMLEPIQGCRVFFAVGSQLYLYFFSPTGGYAAPDHSNPTDPNKGIIYDFVELTYNSIGFWGNTTRVDRYQYPMGVELYGNNGIIQKTGELKTHAEIGNEFLASTPVEFHGCYDPASGAITFPTKTLDFADGTIGSMPNKGRYYNYMDNYIQSIWTKYTNEDLIFDGEMDGIWKGRVQNGRLTMTCQSGKFAGKRGIVERKPTTQEAFEGKGVLDKVVQDATTDLVVQKHICAALTRHMINVTTPNAGVQQWSDVSKFYQTGPCNYYAKFWHKQGISINRMAYGFCYDDVFEQSSTVSVAKANKVVALFGGFAQSPDNRPPTVSITSPSNNATFTAPATVNITANASDSDGSVARVEFFNGTVKIGEDLTSPYSFSWGGVAAGTYSITARATDNLGAQTTSAPVNITVNAVTRKPYGGNPWPIPGIVEAENYDIGGQNISFYDLTANNEGGQYRNDAVDISAMTGGGFFVSHIRTGEWLEYTVNVQTAGNYKLEARVASNKSGKSFALRLDGTNIANISVPNSGGMQNWRTVTVNNINLPAGQKILRIAASSSDFTIDKLTFSSANVNQAPNVSITSPANNSTFTAGTNIAISANATDSDGTVTKVEFFSNGTKIGEDLTSPYSFTWSNVAAGSYTLTARATDNAGASTTSSEVKITVTPPTTTNCTGGVANGDYTYEILSASATSTVKFIPGTPISGTTMVLLYYRVGSGPLIGIFMDPSAGGTYTKSFTAQTGSEVSIYFTYRVGTTMTERNSSATPHTFVAGNCGSQAKAGLIIESDIVSENEMVVYPNPAKSNFDIQLVSEIEQEIQITVCDMVGNIVYREKNHVSLGNNFIKIDVEGLKNGLYYVTVHKNKETLIQKLMIAK